MKYSVSIGAVEECALCNNLNENTDLELVSVASLSVVVGEASKRIEFELGVARRASIELSSGCE